MKKYKIGIVTFPLEKSNVTPLSNLLGIIDYFSDQVYVITGNAGGDVTQKFKNPHFKLIYHTSGSNAITKVFNYAKTQLTLTYHMMKTSKNVDVWIFPIGGEALLPCVVLAKIQRKPVIMSLTSSTGSMMMHHQNPLTPIVVLFVKLNCILATKIILYSSTLISEWKLEEFRSKILITHRHYLDFNSFNVTTPLANRVPKFGYVGRITREKGLLNFTLALPTILDAQQDIRVLIGGDGQLMETIETSLQKMGIAAHVDLPGWIPHEDLPKFLNQLRLLILPSYVFEGLPNIILEAMACGTPVLATPVGMIPDIIIDGKNGFIMENNSSECIVENVIRALNSPDLEQIAENGRYYVEENHTFEKVVAKWGEILEVLNKS